MGYQFSSWHTVPWLLGITPSSVPRKYWATKKMWSLHSIKQLSFPKMKHKMWSLSKTSQGSSKDLWCGFICALPICALKSQPKLHFILQNYESWAIMENSSCLWGSCQVNSQQQWKTLDFLLTAPLTLGLSLSTSQKWEKSK